MIAPTFQPGFRISKFDGVVLAVGTIGAAAAWAIIWWIGFVIAFSVAHFFLFCNVFRISRRLELTWAGIFILLVLGTVGFGVPIWPVTFAISLLVTIVLVGIEMRKPSYHGILWRWVNPDLPQWWAAESNRLA